MPTLSTGGLGLNEHALAVIRLTRAADESRLPIQHGARLALWHCEKGGHSE